MFLRWRGKVEGRRLRLAQIRQTPRSSLSAAARTACRSFLAMSIRQPRQGPALVSPRTIARPQRHGRWVPVPRCWRRPRQAIWRRRPNNHRRPRCRGLRQGPPRTGSGAPGNNPSGAGSGKQSSPPAADQRSSWTPTLEEIQAIVSRMIGSSEPAQPAPEHPPHPASGHPAAGSRADARRDAAAVAAQQARGRAHALRRPGSAHNQRDANNTHSAFRYHS